MMTNLELERLSKLRIIFEDLRFVKVRALNEEIGETERFRKHLTAITDKTIFYLIIGRDDYHFFFIEKILRKLLFKNR
jgi:hypothetical protein